MRRPALLAAGLALVGLGCRHTLDVPRLPQAPVADGRLEDWHGQPRAWWVGDALGGAAGWDGGTLVLLLELRDPAWERAFRQGLVEVRLGGDDDRGRRRVLAVPRSAPAGNDREPLRQAREEFGPFGGKEPEFRWILRGEDFHDERRLPLADGGPQVAWGRSPAGPWSFLEVALPREVLRSLMDKGHLDVELARASVPGGGMPGGWVEPPRFGDGEGPGGGWEGGGMPVGRGRGPEQAPRRGGPEGPHHPTQARTGSPEAFSGLPLTLRLKVDSRE